MIASVCKYCKTCKPEQNQLPVGLVPAQSSTKLWGLFQFCSSWQQLRLSHELTQIFDTCELVKAINHTTRHIWLKKKIKNCTKSDLLTNLQDGRQKLTPYWSCRWIFPGGGYCLNHLSSKKPWIFIETIPKGVATWEAFPQAWLWWK